MSRGSASLGGSRGGGFGGGHSGGSGIRGGGGGGNALGWLIAGAIIGSHRRSGGNPPPAGGNGGGGPQPNNGVQYKLVRDNKKTNIIGSIFAAVCLMFIVLSLVFSFNNVYGLTQGVATDNHPDYQGYRTDYTYTVDGETYNEVLSKLQFQEPADIGETYDIYYKKSDPTIIYEAEGKSLIPSPNAIYIVFAVIFGIITLFIFLGGVRKRVVDEELTQRQEKINQNVVADGKARCYYCGVLMDEGASKCPNCGAPRK
jgi:rubrerythrin